MASCSANICNSATPVAVNILQSVFDPGSIVDGCQITSVLNAIQPSSIASNGIAANNSFATAANNSAKKTMKVSANKGESAPVKPSVEESWKMRQKTLKETNIKNTKGKLWLIYAHGLQDVNNYFVIPEGYYIYFDVMSGEPGIDYVEKEHNEVNSTNIEGNLINPVTRNLVLVGNNFIHMYQPGDLINQHSIMFSPYATGMNHTHETRLLTGIIPPSVSLDPLEFTYDKHNTPKSVKESKYYNKTIDVNEKFFKKEVNTYIDIAIDQTILLSELLKLVKPGHYFVKICRKWSTPEYNPASNKISERGMLHRQLSATSLLNKPWSNIAMNNISAKQLKARAKSTNLFDLSKRGSRVTTDVFVTREPRQNFNKQIERYNTNMEKILKTYDINPKFSDSVPRSVDTSEFAILDYINVHRVLSFNNCAWCHKNLTLLSSKKHICKNCRLACFCSEECFFADQHYNKDAYKNKLTSDFKTQTNPDEHIRKGLLNAKIHNIQPKSHVCVQSALLSHEYLAQQEKKSKNLERKMAKLFSS